MPVLPNHFLETVVRPSWRMKQGVFLLLDGGRWLVETLDVDGGAKGVKDSVNLGLGGSGG